MTIAGFIGRTFKKWGRQNLLSRLVLLVVVVLPMQTGAARDNLTSRQLEIIQTVLNVEGFITQNLHAEFWAAVPHGVHTNADTTEALVRLIKRSIAAGVLFQREGWASAKLSLRAGRVVKTSGYRAAKKAVLDFSQLPEIKRGMQKAVDNAEEMIRAAAEGRPWHTPKGPMYITPELVDQILAGLDGSIARFRRLTNPVWETTVQEYRYPEAHVAILSEFPFAIEKKQFPVENGRRGKATSR